jgi:3-phenylpropionate/trans-cinnamate dioxygenase ferredoxin reductase subunit
MLGFAAPELNYVQRGTSAPNAESPKFLLVGSDDGHIVKHVIAVNAAGDLRQVRSLMEQGAPCDPARIDDTSTPLQQVVRNAIAANAAVRQQQS